MRFNLHLGSARGRPGSTCINPVWLDWVNILSDTVKQARTAKLETHPPHPPAMGRSRHRSWLGGLLRLPLVLPPRKKMFFFVPNRDQQAYEPDKRPISFLMNIDLSYDRKRRTNLL